MCSKKKYACFRREVVLKYQYEQGSRFIWSKANTFLVGIGDDPFLTIIAPDIFDDTIWVYVEELINSDLAYWHSYQIKGGCDEKPPVSVELGKWARFNERAFDCLFGFIQDRNAESDKALLEKFQKRRALLPYWFPGSWKYYNLQPLIAFWNCMFVDSWGAEDTMRKELKRKLEEGENRGNGKKKEKGKAEEQRKNQEMNRINNLRGIKLLCEFLKGHYGVSTKDAEHINNVSGPCVSHELRFPSLLSYFVAESSRFSPQIWVLPQVIILET